MVLEKNLRQVALANSQPHLMPWRRQDALHRVERVDADPKRWLLLRCGPRTNTRQNTLNQAYGPFGVSGVVVCSEHQGLRDGMSIADTDHDDRYARCDVRLQGFQPGTRQRALVLNQDRVERPFLARKQQSVGLGELVDQNGSGFESSRRVNAFRRMRPKCCNPHRSAQLGPESCNPLHRRSPPKPAFMLAGGAVQGRPTQGCSLNSSMDGVVDESDFLSVRKWGIVTIHRWPNAHATIDAVSRDGGQSVVDQTLATQYREHSAASPNGGPKVFQFSRAAWACLRGDRNARPVSLHFACSASVVDAGIVENRRAKEELRGLTVYGTGATDSSLSSRDRCIE